LGGGLSLTEHIALKGTRDGLILYLDPEANFSVLMGELQQLLKDSEQFLQGATVRCFGGDRIFAVEEEEELNQALTHFGLTFAGWLTAEQVYTPGRNSEPVNVEPDKVRVWDEGMVEGPCLFVERTLRSGASIQFEGHVVVLGDVNPGAEIIATGNIAVMGSLRGVAHAGATGERKATVSAYHLAPTQLRIADVVARSPEGTEDWRGPEIAKIKDNQLMVDVIQMTGMKGKGR
jgi:septum site-determining protein MinC